MRHTLIVIAAAIPMLAAAQVPPAPPAPAASPAPRVAPAPRSVPAPRFDAEFDFDFEKFRLHDIRMMTEDAARIAAREMSMLDLDRVRVDVEHARAAALEAVQHIDIEVQPLVEVQPFEFHGGMRDRFSESAPRRAWASEDPADSLYRIARETLIRGEYRRAAQMFSDIVKRFPRSEYVVSCTYWEAFARYRSGSTEDLRQALRILDEGRTTLATLRTNQDAQVDVNALRTRVQSALAARGDEDAARALRREAEGQGSCDPEEMAVKAEALSALGQMDPGSALPVVKKVLARRDECTRELRRRALYVLGRHAGPESASIILDVAKNDTEASIRAEAMRWLPRVAGDNAVPQLEELLRTTADERTQRSVISALSSIDSDRARRAIRAIIERNDASEAVRRDAIVSVTRERDGRPPSGEELAYVRSLYGKLESHRLKEAVLMAVGRVDTPESQQFLMQIVRNQNETPSLRAGALQRLGRMESVSVAEIAKLYDVADTRSLREQIIHGLSQRKENQAVEKIIEIARKDTDPQIRRSAINALSRSDNELAKKFLADMWNQ